jgi:hypothetical protein
MWNRFFVERVFFKLKSAVTIVINWISFWWSFLKRLLLTKCFLLCLWSNLFKILKWNFVFIVFICRTIFFTILRLATFTFLRMIFFLRYSCKTSKKLLVRKLFDMSSNHCFFKASKYAINWTINWLFRWWRSLIFCSTIVIRSLMRLICSLKKSQNCFQKETSFAVLSSRSRYLCQTQSNSETLLFSKDLIKLVWPSSWVRTLFFNPTRPDEQDSKSSPRVRIRGLAQNSNSDESACSDSIRNLKRIVQPVGWTSDSGFGHTTSSGWTFERTKILVRFNSSDKNPNPSNPPGQDRWTRLNPSGGGPMFNPAQP